MSSLYYYAQNGQSQGPVPAERLKELAAAGQLKRDDHICRQGEAKWVPAGQVKGLFAAEEPPLVVAADAPDPEAGPAFHYRQKGRQSGPVSREELRRRARAGQLRPEDFVWQEGTAAWVPAARLDGLFDGRRCQVNGVSFLHPRDWTVNVKSSEASRKVFNISVTSDAGLLMLCFSPAKSYGPEEALKDMRENLEGNDKFKDLAFTKSGSSIAGEKAEGYDYKFTVMRIPHTGKLHAARVGPVSVTLFWQASDERFPGILPVADLLRASMTVEE
jgi:hypothetical protein